MADVALLTLQINSSQAEAAANRMDRTLKRLDVTAEQVGQGFVRLGRRMTALVTAPIAALGIAGIKFAADIEKATVAMGVFLGSIEEGQNLYKQLVDFSASTPLQLPQITKATEMLLAMGAATQDTIIPTLRNLGNLARGNGELLGRLSLALGQVAAQGKLTGRELLRFTRAGINIVSALANTMGRSEDEIRKMVSTGQIGFKDVAAALDSLDDKGGMFEDLMSKIASTIAGRFSTALDNARIAMADLVEPILPFVTRAIEMFISFAQKVQSLSKQFRVVIAGVALFLASLGPILTVIGQLILFKAALAVIGTTFAGLVGPVLLFLGKMLLIIGAIVLAVEGLRRSFGITWEEIGAGALTAFRHILGFLMNIRTNWDIIITWLGANWQALLADMVQMAIIFSINLAKNIKVGLELAAEVIGVFIGWFQDNWQGMLGQLVAKVVAFIPRIVILMKKMAEAISKALRSAVTGEELELPDFSGFLLKGAIRTGTIGERLAGAFNDAADRFTPLLQGFQRTTEEMPDLVTDFKLFEERFKDITDRGPGEDDSPGDAPSRTVSEQLAGALRAGSREAFGLITKSGRERTAEKTAKRNLTANERTAFEINRISTEGVKIKGVRTIDDFS
jgi:tape measure domain-containing protein